MSSWQKDVGRRAAQAAARLYTVPTASLRGLPDFLIIGAQRGGTTSLYRYLERHPAVLPAVLNKGIHYFDTNFDRGPRWYRSYFPSAATKSIRRRRASVDRVITGEASPYYVFHPLAPGRIADLIPDVMAILILRDPIQRAHSHYQHEVARGFEELSFEEALVREEDRLGAEEDRMRADPHYYSFEHQHHSYISRGVYLSQIKRWEALFPSERLLIIDAAEFFDAPDATFRGVLRFLGLEEMSLPRYEKMNSHSYDRMSARSLGLLRERFQPANRELFEHLGRELPWDREGL